MNKPKDKRKFGGKWYTYSGFTWGKKGKERRKKFWNKLGYSVRFISSKGYIVKPLPKSKYLVYTRKKKHKSSFLKGIKKRSKAFQ